MAELTRRYIVMSMGTEGPFDMKDPDAAFVLKPWKDPAALRALEAYREHCYPGLAKDLDEWIAAIRSGPTLRGDVGARNQAHMAAKAAVKSPRWGAGASPGAASKAKSKRTPRKASSKKRKLRR